MEGESKIAFLSISVSGKRKGKTRPESSAWEPWKKRDVRGVNFEFSLIFSMLEAIPFLFLHLHFQRVISKNIGFKHEPDARA